MRICVVTPWYPDRAHPFAGVFVRQQVEALREAGAVVEIEVEMTHSLRSQSRLEPALRAVGQLALQNPSAVFGEVPGVSVVPSFESRQTGYAGRAESFARTLEIKRRHRPIKADVVHAHVALPAGYAAVRCSEQQPVVVTEHFTGLAQLVADPRRAEMYRAVIENSSHFALVSNSLRSTVAERMPALASRLELTPNIVDTRSIPFRRRRGIGRRWLYVGRLSETKNVKLLLRSFDRFQASEPNSDLTIVGDGPLRGWVERYVDRRGLGSAVRLAGAVDHSDVGAEINDADVLVHLSRVETFGISTLEAIGAGLPVVNLDNGAAKEIWGEIELAVGRILPVDADEDAVCDAIADLSASTSLDPEVGRSFVETRYSPSAVASHLLDLYRGVS